MVYAFYYRQNINGTYKIKQNIKNQTKSPLYTDDKKSQCFSNLNDTLKLPKKPYIKEITSKTVTAEFLREIKSQVNNFTTMRPTVF